MLKVKKNILVLKKIIFLKNYFEFFPLKIDSITLDLDLDPNWAKILVLDPDPNSMYLDPQHWTLCTLSFSLLYLK